MSSKLCRVIHFSADPDLRFFNPDRELANPQIKIEQVREIEQQFVYRPLMGERKICLIDEADRMTIGAANACSRRWKSPRATRSSS